MGSHPEGPNVWIPSNGSPAGVPRKWVPTGNRCWKGPLDGIPCRRRPGKYPTGAHVGNPWRDHLEGAPEWKFLEGTHIGDLLQGNPWRVPPGGNRLEGKSGWNDVSYHLRVLHLSGLHLRLLIRRFHLRYRHLRCLHLSDRYLRGRLLDVRRLPCPVSAVSPARSLPAQCSPVLLSTAQLWTEPSLPEQTSNYWCHAQS
jgi:hypothetical protein